MENDMATEVVMPALGLTVEKGTIVKWLKREGDPVERGESLCEIEADKATTEIESPATGVLAKILVAEGIQVPLFTVLAIITAAGEQLPEAYARAGEPPPADAPGQAAVAKAAPPPAEPVLPLSAGRARVVPAARRRAAELGIDLSRIQGTGPDGVIGRNDVEAFLKRETQSPPRASTLARRLAEEKALPLEGIAGSGVRGRIMQADVESALEKRDAPALGKVIPMTRMRQAISRRLSQSVVTAPHVYFFTDVHLDPLLEFRNTVLSGFEAATGLRPSINDFLIQAAALALADMPLLNAYVQGEEIVIPSEIHIGLAVALPEGLVVPAIPNADQAGLAEITRQRIDLVARAKSGRLALAELERGTFTISSLAQFDITHFTAILNPPQSGILSVSKTRESLYLADDGAVKARQVSTFGLSVDHRIIDGAVAAGFLQNLKRKLEIPAFTFLRV
jgi:pyruvate dehydrogenase E2 component (dihydrolipoamide acetyltransferase)